MSLLGFETCATQCTIAGTKSGSSLVFYFCNVLSGKQDISIELERGGIGLGFKIAGGMGSPPWKQNDNGIFVTDITPGGPANVAGLLKDDKVKEGDLILSCK